MDIRNMIDKHKAKNKEDESRKFDNVKTRFTRRVKYLKKKYGLSIDEYERLLMAQNNKCAVCGEEGNKNKLVIDHCRKTGKVRELLCNECNLALGLLYDNKFVLENMVRYLEKYSEVIT